MPQPHQLRVSLLGLIYTEYNIRTATAYEFGEKVKQILFALKEVFLSYTPSRSFIEAMIKYDFKVGDAKTSEMQLCFSNLATWPLIFILLFIQLDPFKISLSLVKLLSFESSVVLFLLDGHQFNMLILFFIFYFIEWIIRKEYILIALVFYFLQRSELHIHLATVAVLAVYLSRICYLWWLSVDSESETKKIWKTVSALQLWAWIFVSFTTISALDYIQTNFLFNEASELNRVNFLCLAILLYHVFSHLFLSLWGHFYFQKNYEPANLPTYYSTTNWILRFNMSYYLQSLLKSKIAQELEKHIKNVEQLQELKILHPAMAKLSVETVLKKETDYLKEANLRIDKLSGVPV